MRRIGHPHRLRPGRSHPLPGVDEEVEVLAVHVLADAQHVVPGDRMVLQADGDAALGTVVGHLPVAGDHGRPGRLAVAVLLRDGSAEHADERRAEEGRQVDHALRVLGVRLPLLGGAVEQPADADVGDRHAVLQTEQPDRREIRRLPGRERRLVEVDAVQAQLVAGPDEVLDAHVPHAQ